MNYITETINHYLDEIYQYEVERRESALAEMIKHNDFICGSMAMKKELEEVYPFMSIYYSSLIDERQIFMIKKWDVSDLI